MKVYLASDHAGFELKEAIKEYLNGFGLDYEVVDLGAFSFNDGDDYPDFVTPLAHSVVTHRGSFGIICGGSGQGEAMCANRVHGARAAVFYGPKLPTEEVDIEGRKSNDTFEIIKLEREHNNANILSIGARFVTADEAKFAVELFLAVQFKNQERHLRRVEKF